MVINEEQFVLNVRLVWLIEITRNYFFKNQVNKVYFWPPKSEINSQQNILKIAKTSKKKEIYIYREWMWSGGLGRWT